MKRIISLLAVVLFTVSIFAQAPDKISYQAVMRDASGFLVQSHNVGMRVSILQGSTSGISAYTESDPIFSAHVVSNISVSDIDNWNIAYSWGDHAIQGYLKTFTETDPVFGA